MLAKNNPLQSAFDDEVHKHQQAHAHDVCGLVAHTKDRSVTSFLQTNCCDEALTV